MKKFNYLFLLICLIFSQTKTFGAVAVTVNNVTDGILSQPPNFFTANYIAISNAINLNIFLKTNDVPGIAGNPGNLYYWGTDGSGNKGFNLLGNSAILNIGTTSSTVAAGDDSRFLTLIQLLDLVGGANSTNHYHDTDRDRANHTGTQTKSTISDFAHNTTHQDGGNDEIGTATPGANAIPKATSGGKLDSWISDASLTNKGLVELASNVETTAGLVVQADDSRLSDSRTPLTHATSHKNGGSDPIKLDELAIPDDNTTLDANTDRHGLLRKLTGNPAEYLDGSGGFSTPVGAGDITSIGDVTAGAAFNGTQGTTLTFADPDGNQTISYDTTNNRFVVSADFALASAGILFSTDNDGQLIIRSLGNGFLENLMLNLDDTENTGVFSSSTGLNTLNFSSINLQESGNAVPNATDNLSFFSATTSSQLASIISDETGTGGLVLSNSPSISGDINFSSATSFKIPAAGTLTTDEDGEIYFDNNAFASGRGTIRLFDGTTNVHVITVLSTDTPVAGQVVKYNADGYFTFEDDSAGSGAFDTNANYTITGNWTINGDWVFAGGVTTTTSNLVANVISLGTNSVQLSDDGDGAFIMRSIAGGNNESLIINLDDTANTIVVSSDSGVSLIDFNFDLDAANLTEGGIDVPNANNHLGFFASTTSAELAGIISNETGTGNLVFSASPTLTGTLTAATVAASTLTEGGSAVPNATDHLGFFSATTSAQLAGVISDETGTGSLVLSNSPTFGGTVTASTINATTLTEGGDAVPNSLDNLSFFASTTSAQLFSIISDETGAGGALVSSISPTLSGQTTVSNILATTFTLGSAGVHFTHDSDGAITLLGLGNGDDEDLTLNFDDVANTIGLSSSTGVTNILLSSMSLSVINEEYDDAAWVDSLRVATQGAIRNIVTNTALLNAATNTFTGEMHIDIGLSVGGSGPSTFTNGIVDGTIANSLVAVDGNGAYRNVNFGAGIDYDTVTRTVSSSISSGATLGIRTNTYASVNTTSASATTILSVPIPNDNGIGIEAYIQGDGQTNSSEYKLAAKFRNTGGSLAQTGSTAAMASIESTAALNASFTTSSTNVLLQVTGIAGETINWYADWTYLIKTNVIAEAVAPTYLLNSATNLAFAAYSLSRKLTTNYSGSAFTLIRDSDWTTNNIGFDGEEVDITSAESFVGGGNNGYILTVYDQSGNGRHLVGSTNRLPLVINGSGAIMGSNNRLAATWDGVDDQLLTTTTFSQAVPFTHVLVASMTTIVNNDILVGGNSTINVALKQTSSPQTVKLNSGGILNYGSTLSTGTWYLFRGTWVTGMTDSLRINNGTETTGDGGDNGINNELNWGHFTLCPSMNGSEWIVFTHSLTSNDETTLRNNINTFYAIY